MSNLAVAGLANPGDEVRSLTLYDDLFSVLLKMPVDDSTQLRLAAKRIILSSHDTCMHAGDTAYTFSITA